MTHGSGHPEDLIVNEGRTWLSFHLACRYPGCVARRDRTLGLDHGVPSRATVEASVRRFCAEARDAGWRAWVEGTDPAGVCPWHVHPGTGGGSAVNVPDPDATWLHTALLLAWPPARVEALAAGLEPCETVVLVRYEGIVVRLQRHPAAPVLHQVVHRDPTLTCTLAMRRALARAGFSDAWLADAPSRARHTITNGYTR